MNTIVIQLCQEDRDRLDRILDALKNRPDCAKCADSVATYVAEQVSQPAQVPAEETQETVDTAPAEKPAEATEKPQEKPKVSKADIQKKVVELSAAGKKAGAREIVMAYATKVTDIPEDKLAEVWQKLTALEG